MLLISVVATWYSRLGDRDNFISRFIDLISAEPGEYITEDLCKDLQDPDETGRKLTTSSSRQTARVTYSMLVEFSLDSRFMVPFMYKWIVYRSPLKRSVYIGKRTSAERLAGWLLYPLAARL